jgi:predicted ATP-dependent serine protease
MDEIRRSKNVILFIDELHTIVGAGSAEGALDASNIIKPTLSRGELQWVGATTLNEYRKYIEKEVADIRAATVAPEASQARVSSGLERLDAMLGSGYLRGSSVLITGSAGTGKSILARAFAEAACLHKERTFYVSFDENPSQIGSIPKKCFLELSLRFLPPT